MELTGENVSKTFLSLLFKEAEIPQAKVNAVPIEGVILRVGFNPERLKEKQTDIEQMLLQLPDQFMKSKGGGWSFLNACEDNKGSQWTGLHQTMDELLTMGLAINKVSFVMPREMWNFLPGGMPYFVVNDK